MRFITWFRITLYVMLIGLLSLAIFTHAQDSSTADKLQQMGGQPCPDSDFTCVTLTVPLNHFAADKPLTIDVVFAVLPATGERKGMFVTATGGPGSSGIASADSYTASFDPSIPEHFDIVFFDQRGVAASGGLQCASTATAYYQTDADMKTPEGEKAYVDASKTFADDCLKEMDVNPEYLPYYGTNQAVEDLDLFRQAMGDDKIWLYGESYGTQYAQTYAAAHPDHLAGLILDGTVDLTLTGTDFLKQQAQAFSDVLVETLKACNDSDDCKADFAEGDALKFYDDLTAELTAAPVTVDFPLPSGEKVSRPFTIADLETAASSYVYSEGSRMILQRALAAASQGNLVLLARTLYDSLGLDEETLAAVPDPTYSDAMYYAVECDDYNYPGATPDKRANNYVHAGDATDNSIPYFSSIFYGDLPCAFWPGSAPSKRPAPLTADGIPTLVLGATADPATPVENGKSVFKRLQNGYLVTAQGGAHVIYGRGDECPDKLVTDFLVSDKMPDQRETTCDSQVASDYVPLAPADASSFTDPLEALDSAYNEIYYLPEYYYWDTTTLTLIACPFGGTLAFAPGDNSDQFHLSGCAFSKGFTMTGSGVYDHDSSDFTLDVNVSGLHEGTLSYKSAGDGSTHVTGDYEGQSIDLSG
jgi:pimeloyl-ACP methyl ester carboxylesterase